MSSEQQSAPPEPADAQVDEVSLPDDANDLRNFHFKLLLGKAITWILIGVVVLASGIAGAVFIGPAIGGAAAVGVFLLALLIVFAIADSRAEESFFQTYATQRGMSLSGRQSLPPATPLLRKGDDRYAERMLSGSLADGVEGVLALYTYEVESTDSKGHTQTDYYRYTVGMIEVPECTARVPELFCQRKFGLRALEKLEDAFRGSKQRVTLESEALLERYEIFANENQDQSWLPALLPHLHRLADRLGPGEVQLRAGQRHALLLRQQSQEGRRGARCGPHRLRRGRHPAARRVLGVVVELGAASLLPG